MPARFALLIVLALSTIAQASPKITIALTKASGIYALNENVTWTVSIKDGTTPCLGLFHFSVLKGGLTEITSGRIELVDGKGEVTSSRNDPGVLLLMIKYKDANHQETVAHAGAAFAPRKVAASSPPPDDFDTFWKAKIATLDAIPLNVKLERVDIGDTNIEYFKITMNNVNGRKIYGQIAKPTGKSKLPALLQVQWAGVYPLQRDWVTGYAKNGWLAMNISAHDLPIDQPQNFYNEKSNKELNDYPGIGNDNRETSYFLPMFLSCRRAVDYLTQHPDWNKTVLVVHGGSQGGYQALVTAGIHPAVTAFAANVPAGCDHTGKAVGRVPGWPNWASRTWQNGKTEANMLEAARYFDAMNFATRIGEKCQGIVGLGLADTVCPAEGVLATCNQIRGAKKLVIMPLADHGGDHHAYNEVFGAFLKQQKERSN